MLSNKPVIATGRSWFNGLNIFHEPKDWDNLSAMVNDPKVYRMGPTQLIMRKKWINWWVKHQFLQDEASSILKDSIREFHSKKGEH